MVAVIRLQHHRQAHALGGLPGGFGTAHQFALRHGHAAGLQQGFGQVFVAGDFFGNGTGLVGLGGPDAALRHAVAQLHQIAFGQADVRNAARGGRVHDVGGAGPQAKRIDHVAERGYCPSQVKRGVVDGGQQQITPGFQCGAAHLLLAGAKSHFVDAALGGLARFAKAGAHTREVLQLQADVFQDMRRPGAFAQALQKAATHAGAAFVLNQAGQPGGEPLHKAGQGVGRKILQLPNVHPGLNDRSVGPDIGPAQVIHPQYVYFFLARHGMGWVLRPPLGFMVRCVFSLKAAPWHCGVAVSGIVGVLRGLRAMPKCRLKRVGS